MQTETLAFPHWDQRGAVGQNLRRVPKLMNCVLDAQQGFGA